MEAALVGPYGRTPLGATKITIGRASDNTIVVNDQKASSHHAEIRPEGQYYNLVDLGSMNGTFVNEQQVYSGTPRPLQPGDSIRIGDTRFTFEASNTGQSPYYDSTVQAVPPPPVMPNYAGNTSYGMGNYGSQPNYPPTEFAQPQQYPAPAYSDPYNIPPVQQPPYSSETQVPTYVAPSYGQTGGQTASAPNYPPQPQTQFSGYTPPQPQPRRSPMRTIILAVIALVIILAAVSSFLLISHNNQVSQQNATATTTARNSTATAQAIAQQTAQAQATVTAEKQSHYPPFTTVALFDTLATPTSTWNSSSICQFNSSSYTISIQQAHTLQYCLNNSQQFGEIAYQVTLTVQQGDCGGLVFRYVDNNNFYYIDVCQDGTYDLGDYVNGTQNLRYNNTQSSSAIIQGTGKQNVIAVTVQGDTVNLFINGKSVDTATSQALTSSTFTQGEVGLLADDLGDPTVVSYTNALVWTSSS
jgi:pSer/pThr/pTyr-binding forkhead associated (FHA) protein